MRNRSNIWIALTLAVILIAVMATAVDARAVDIFVGRWQTMDIPGDGSTNTLTIAFRRGPGDYRLIWQETFFSICSGDPGVGRGTGTENLTGINSSFDFFCMGTPTLSIDIDFTYNSENDTLSSATGEGGIFQIWQRISPSPF